MPGLKPSRQEAVRACQESKPFAKLAAKRLPFSEVKRELKGAVITEHADGKGMDIHDPTEDKRHMKRLCEMQAEYKALDYEIGQASVLASFPEHEREAIVNARGEREVLPGRIAEQKARKLGLHAVRKWGRPRQRTVYGADGVNLVYHAEPGGALTLVRAYRLVDDGRRVSREIEVPLCQI